MAHGEEPGVLRVISRAFDRFVAPELSREGIEEFYRYAAPEPLAQRAAEDDQELLVAVAGGKIVGAAELLRRQHIAMLFVDPDWMGLGLGRRLLDQALGLCERSEAGGDKVTVHASRFAVPFYAAAGFRPEGPERSVNGIRFLPMALDLSSGAEDHGGER